MLYRKIKEFLYENKLTIVLVLSLSLYTTDAFAAPETFTSMIEAAKNIFSGLRKVIYPAATIGIASVCIAGMFGSFNWKWLVAILLGVFIIAYAEQVGGLATDAPINLNGDD